MTQKENPYAARSRAPGFRHFIYAFLIVHGVLFPLSGFRAWVQVYSVELTTSSNVATPGTRIVAKVETSGRIGIAVDISARQGSRAISLASMTIPSNEQAIYDPRPRRDSLVVLLTTESLHELSPGPTSIVASATGRPQFTRMPPPVIRQLAMTVPR